VSILTVRSLLLGVGIGSLAVGALCLVGRQRRAAGVFLWVALPVFVTVLVLGALSGDV
jgi:predicted membrane protein